MQKLLFRIMLWLVFILLAGCTNESLVVEPEQPKAKLPEETRKSPLSQDETGNDNVLKSMATKISGQCNSPPDPGKAQYIIGYGSLMQDESRKRSAPSAGDAYPVMVNGYRRGWFAKGGSVGFDTTYLGVVPDSDSKLNAVIYKIPAKEIPAMDQREYFYCRLAVKAAAYTLLRPGISTSQGQVWIYVNKPESIATANASYPIVQSYVDIFVSGCQEQEQRYALKEFAQQCLKTTRNWSTEWVNDRLYPRRPFIYQPKAGQIDKLLKASLPNYFQKIRIESAE